MARRDVKLIGSLVDYVNDVKPYHTKLREFSSEILLSDTCNVNVIDDHHLSAYLQNLWSRDDLGGQSLSKLTDGSASDRTFKIPAAIWPHFSINDSLNYNQTPLGDDPAVDDLTDSDGDGIPDYEQPYTLDSNESHFYGGDWIPVAAVIIDVEIFVTSVTKLSELDYTFDYQILVYIDSGIEGRYGLGNSWQMFLNGEDVTFYTDHTESGAYDIDPYDVDPYDTGTRIFTINGRTSTFTLTSDDFAIFPSFSTISNETVCQYWFAKNRPKINLFYTQTGRYKVPFHQGSRVYVDGVACQFDVEYVVESGRDFIQFLAGHHPIRTSTVTVNLMKVDRLFISKTNPLEIEPADNNNQNWTPWISSGYDQIGYEDLPYDIGLPATVCDYYTFKIDDSYPGRCSPVSFMNASTLGSKPTLTVLDVSFSALNGEIYIVYATGPWTFAVQQIAPYIGDVQYGSFKTIFSNGKISFILDKTWTSYYMIPDAGTYSDLQSSYDIYSFAPVDVTDHLLSLNLRTEHGVSTDPLPPIHKPVEYALLGKVMRVADDSGIENYEFVLSDVPPIGIYYEIMVQQNGDLWMNATISDEIIVTMIEAGNDATYNDVYNSRIPLITADTVVTPPPPVDDNTYVEAGYVDPGYVE